MIDRDYCVMMARYNAWQNNLLLDVLETLDASEITKKRKSFFGSILNTLNHILWADMMWMSRISDDATPGGGIPESTDLHPTLAAWSAERFRVDGRIRLWANKVSNIELQGDLSFYSGSVGANVTRPAAICIAHMFNHQTHHRGQVHGMITEAGAKTPVSDLFFLPEDA